jgi:two-component system sensor histidine kinase UhpB
MSTRHPGTSRALPLRRLAASRLAKRPPVRLDELTPNDVRALVEELEIHKVELEIQNEQLRDTQSILEQAKERYRLLYETAPIGFLTLDAEGKITDANLTAAALLQLPRSRLVGRKLSRFVTPRHQDRWHLERRALASGAERRNLELDLVLSDGTPLHAQLVGSGTPEMDGAPGTIRLALLDDTELRSLARTLRKAATAAALSEHQERRALATELHDDAGQLLALASLKLRALGDSEAGQGAVGIREVEDVLAETRRRISSLSFQLSPSLLHDVGLVAAAHWLAEDKEQRFGLVVRIERGEELELDEAARVTLFRALRELLLNVIKHARVGEARVRIWRAGSMASVAVEDAGIGFDPAAVRSGFGLLALRDRVTQMGGRLETTSAPGSGTRVVVSVPCALRGTDGEGGLS